MWPWPLRQYPTINSVGVLVPTRSIFPWSVRVVFDRLVRYNGKHPLSLHLFRAFISIGDLISLHFIAPWAYGVFCGSRADFVMEEFFVSWLCRAFNTNRDLFHYICCSMELVERCVAPEQMLLGNKFVSFSFFTTLLSQYIIFIAVFGEVHNFFCSSRRRIIRAWLSDDQEDAH